uniref:Uncharacterized protein n=2 Tax=Theileria parva TaxID=5875 RepID=Q4N721_THEPA|eukprot:XP_766520.1 hypothetical protein [Theileria parva strain Muguga]
MIVASVGCFFSVYLRSQYLLFGFLLFLLSMFLTSRKGAFGFASLTPFYGMLPSLIKVTGEVFRCIVNGEPL